MRICLSNIERYLYLFQDGNTDFGNPSWAEPVFAAMLRAYQNDEELVVDIGNEYIRKMILDQYTPQRTYSPIENIITRNNLDEIATHTTSVMMQNFEQLGLEDQKDLNDYLHYLFIELMNNIVDHSHSEVGGYTMAQYFVTKEKIQYVVADRGIGILANMQLNYHDVQTEEEAIMMALEKGITSTRATMYGAERNAGMGLYGISKILEMTGGKFIIISNDTIVKYANGRFSSLGLEYPWKGVVVAFEFDEAKINHNMDYFNRMYLWNGSSEEDDEDFY